MTFIRNKWFETPRRLTIQKRAIDLAYPAEHGVKVDFVVCFIRNDYGLGTDIEAVHSILDVGANVGFFSLAARGIYPTARIDAYEPNPRVLHYLHSNLEKAAVNVYGEAIGPTTGAVLIADTGDSNAASTRTCKEGNIPQVALSDAIRRIGGTVDLLKLDCEGAEWDLFAIPDPWRAIRDLRMEYHLLHNRSFNELRRHLADLGFSITSHRSDTAWGIVWAKNRFKLTPCK